MTVSIQTTTGLLLELTQEANRTMIQHPNFGKCELVRLNSPILVGKVLQMVIRIKGTSGSDDEILQYLNTASVKKIMVEF